MFWWLQVKNVSWRHFITKDAFVDRCYPLMEDSQPTRWYVCRFNLHISPMCNNIWVFWNCSPKMKSHWIGRRLSNLLALKLDVSWWGFAAPFFASRFNMSWAQRCYSANFSCGQWMFELLALLSSFTSLIAVLRT